MPMETEDSILKTIRMLLLSGDEPTPFDVNILVGINSAIFILTQLGVGPPGGFSVKDENEKWSDFVDLDSNFEAVKTYIHLKTKLVFDPPSSAALIDSINAIIDEIEWRLREQADMK